MLPGSYLLGLIKIGIVTAEIFLIWTDVARSNVNLTVGSVLDVPRMLPLKCHQNQVSNSIFDMDKCNQDKCCLHCDS